MLERVSEPKLSHLHSHPCEFSFLYTAIGSITSKISGSFHVFSESKQYIFWWFSASQLRIEEMGETLVQKNLRGKQIYSIRLHVDSELLRRSFDNTLTMNTLQALEKRRVQQYGLSRHHWGTIIAPPCFSFCWDLL